RAGRRASFLPLPGFWPVDWVSRGMPPKPIPAILVRARRLSDLPALHRRINVSAETQAVFPSAVLLNIFNILGLVEEVLAVVLGIAAVVVLLYLFVSMYSATVERRREIA